MATGTIKAMNYTFEEINHTTANDTEIDISVDLSKYDFLYLKIGSASANYASAILPTCLAKNTVLGMQCFAFNTSGDYICRGAMSLATNKLLTTDVNYPAFLYGLKKS